MRTVVTSLLLLFFLLISSVSAQDNSLDVLQLKNGTIVKGTIVEVIPNESVKIKLSDGKVYVYPINEIQSITQEPIPVKVQPKPPDKNAKPPGYRYPGTAFALSFFFVGAGQFYNGDIGKGFAQILFVGSGIALIAYDSNRRGGHYSGSGINFARFTGFSMILGGALWSMIDAPLTAIKKNNKLKRPSPYGHFLEFQTGSQIVGVDLGFDGKSLGGRVTLHF